MKNIGINEQHLPGKGLKNSHGALLGEEMK